VLSADGTAKSLSLVMSPEAPATWADPSGTYVVAADGSISLKFQDGNVSEDVKLLPCAGGYANPVFVHP
jgi:hypothetical protein